MSDDRNRQSAYCSFTTQVPVGGEYDVVVCGGGVAGCIAAIQAAREGARTALIEKNGILGGTAVSAGVNFPGLFHIWGRQIIAGIGWEIIEEAARQGGATMPDFTKRPRHHYEHQVRINHFIFASLLDQFCLDAKVSLHLHEMPVAVQEAGNRLVVVTATKTGLQALSTNVVIDATGDANVAQMMGYPLEQGMHLQPGTLIYEMNGYNMADINETDLQNRYDEAIATGKILPTDHGNTRGKHTPFWRELVNGGGNRNHIVDIDGSSSAGRTLAELKGRQAIKRIYDFLRSVPGCEQLQITYIANECGVRETRRIVGESYIDHASYISGRIWPDAVCYSYYPIDIHQHNNNTIDIRPLAEGTVPTIPYGALIPQGSDKLLAAGRCISGDTEASSAYRVQATCMATGQAAGAAAALAAKTGASVRDIDVCQIRAILRKHNAIVPEQVEQANCNRVEMML